MNRIAKFSTALIALLALVLVVPAIIETPNHTPPIPQANASGLSPASADPDIGYLSVAHAPAEHERQLEEQRLEAERLEAERLAAERLSRSASTIRTQNAPQSFDMPAECTGKPIPAHIVMRESRCNYGSVNQTGCSGYTCVGMYQFDLRHWIAKEDGGWGGCAHYGDWRIPENQDACASQMSRGGTYLAPWGG